MAIQIIFSAALAAIALMFAFASSRPIATDDALIFREMRMLYCSAAAAGLAITASWPLVLGPLGHWFDVILPLTGTALHVVAWVVVMGDLCVAAFLALTIFPAFAADLHFARIRDARDDAGLPGRGAA